MRIAPDTNVLARAILDDEPRQSESAKQHLAQAEAVVISLPVLCELAWVLARAARIEQGEIVRAFEALTETSNVVIDRPAVDAGLKHLRAGGDFADGVIAHEGRRMGASLFVTFDLRAARLVRDGGGRVEALA